MTSIHLEKTLMLIDEALALSLRDGQKNLAFLLQMASLEASEQIETDFDQESSQDYGEF